MAETLRDVGLKQVAFLEERGIDPYPGEIPPRTHFNAEIARDFDTLADQRVDLVGRLVAVRAHGRRFFFDLQDESGRVQGMLTHDPEAEDDRIDLFKGGFSVGDFVGVSGRVMKTRSGEVTVDVGDLRMLAKAILPPPEELRDTETRYRQRYLDLMANNEVVERFKFR